MEYKRLTNTQKFYEDEVVDMDEIYERLAELEDKIERGELAEVPEGAVVLTKEEYDAINITEEQIVQWKQNFKDEIETQILEIKEQARKETAREIYKRLCNVEYSIYDNAYGYAGALVSEFEKIFNEYGIEVEE